MSFILDQLKKSGKQRALVKAMRRQTVKSEEKKAEPLSLQSENRTPVSVKKWQVVAVAVLLGIVVLYGAVSFFGVSSPVRQPIVPVPKRPVQAEAPLPSTPVSVSLVKIPDAPVRQERASDPKSPAAKQIKTEAAKAVKPVTAQDKRRDTFEQSGATRSTETIEKKLPAAKIDAPGGLDSSGSVSTGSVLEFKQLPQAVRKSLPEIRVTSHLYRKDSRLVSINGRIMTEGFNMDNGLYLEEITPEGVILSFRNHRFRVKAN
ncbi:MAG: general secretion pathway protein GspB [Nitrospirota bacterium]|nr:general secretion pathway protein GspB [Nitrospirota bacterium]